MRSLLLDEKEAASEEEKEAYKRPFSVKAQNLLKRKGSQGGRAYSYLKRNAFRRARRCSLFLDVAAFSAFRQTGDSSNYRLFSYS